MSEYTKLVINCATGEQSEVALTEEEIAERELQVQAWLAEEAERKAVAKAKAEAKASAAAKLAALGLTAEEIAALS